MIRGDIFQMAYVVEDLDAAIDHWTRILGVGPFFLFPLPLQLDWLERNGTRTDAHDILSGVGLAQSGGVQIELIVPGPDPSAYRDFWESGRRGLHHVGVYATDYDAEMAAIRAAGVTVTMEGLLPLSQFAYLETGTRFPGTMLELIDAKPEMRELFGMIADASRGWDGTDPVRRL
jgi:catechol 2,3-dioxygenase-like lactoylglutathione lyase family enzyme